MRIFAVMGIVLILTGCDKSRVYEFDHDFNGSIWKASDVRSFEFEIADLAQLYNIHYRVRNSSEYPFSRIFVSFKLIDPTEVELQSGLVSNYLFDQKSGVPFGSSGVGDKFDHQFLLIGKRKFTKKGKYHVTLEQFMRTDTLSGIEALGVRVERAQ